MARRFFIDESVKPASLYVVEGDSLVAEAYELERGGNAQSEEIGIPPKGTGRAPILEEDDGPRKKKRRCKLCGKPGHRKDNCPNGRVEMGPSARVGELPARIEALPEPVTTDEGSYYPITDKATIDAIWECVDEGTREYGAIAHQLGRNPLAVKAVLLAPRP